MYSNGGKGLCQGEGLLGPGKRVEYAIASYRLRGNMYIDPNTGGVVFQALAALLAVGSGFLLVFSGRIRESLARMRRRMRKDKDEDQA